MRLISFSVSEGSPHVGVKLEGGKTCADITPVAVAAGLPALRDVRDVLLLGDDWRATADQLAAEAAIKQEYIMDVADLTLLAPVGTRSLLLCSGGNFLSHRKEMTAASGSSFKPAEQPRGFIKNCAAVIGERETIRLPRRYPDMVDYEGEIAAVISSQCFDLADGHGFDYIAGYTLLNDVSARNWSPTIRAAKTGREAIDAWERNIMCKQFPTFCPIGPEFVTSDEIDQPGQMPLRTLVNGEVRQDATLEDLEFDLGQLVVHYSRHYLLRPGDVVTTGTPSGVAIGMETPGFLRPGDSVRVESSAIGTLCNVVALSAENAGTQDRASD